MKKSSSTPSILGLGIQMPHSGSHLRKSTFRFRLDGNVLDLVKPLPASDEAKMAADQVKNYPSWRLVASQMGLTEGAPRPGPMGLTDHPPQVPPNMRWPRITPAWLKHEKQCLRFYCYFQEHVIERVDENSRYRQCVIIYNMEDGTMRIDEPKVENSGIPQGVFLKRHRVPKDDGTFLGPGDLRVGEEVIIYGRKYHITGADRFTRWFFEENGIDLGPDEPPVEDLWEKSYKFSKMAEKGGLAKSRDVIEGKHANAALLGVVPPGRKLMQFLENDRKVLRLYAYWDDPTLYGARIYLNCHYYLADNTFEANEAHARNSGRDNYPVFYKRGPLNKENRTNAYPGMLEPDAIPYLPEDFRVGGAFYIWGRKCLIYDCDDFTQEFYKGYLGIDQKINKVDVSDVPLKHVVLPPPPHTGIGFEEDSLINCQMIRPKQPKKNLQKMMTLTGEVLRFEAKLVNGQPEDECRTFIICYYPADDEVAVFELQQRNSGFTGGRFCEKNRYTNVDTGKRFRLADLPVGRTVMINSHPLLIVRADERCLQYCENHPDEFPWADLNLVARKIVPAIKDATELQDPSGVSPDVLKYVALQNGVELVDHEIITLLRNCPTGPPAEGGVAKISWDSVVALC